MQDLSTQNITGQLSDLWTELAPTVIEWGLNVLGGIAVLIFGLFVAKWVRRGIRKIFDRTDMDETLEKFITSLSYYLVLIVAAVAALGMMGVETASVLAMLGAAGLAVGLALQGALSNVAAGVMLLIFRPFGVDDFVDAGGTAGTVDSIGLFATILNTPDNVRIVVPNAVLYGGIIKNFSFNDTRRNDMVFGISYDDDIGVAMETIKAVLEAESRVLSDPEYLVAVSELADSSVNLVVRPWCLASDYWALRFDLQRTLKEKLEAAGCSIPYPQQDVYVRKID